MRSWIAVSLLTLWAVPVLAQPTDPVPLVRIDVVKPPAYVLPGTRSTAALRAVVTHAPKVPLGAPAEPVWSWQISRAQRLRAVDEWEDTDLADRLTLSGEDTAQPTVTAELPLGGWRLLVQVTAVWHTSPQRTHELACATTAAWVDRLFVTEPPRITLHISIGDDREAKPADPLPPPPFTPPAYASHYASALDNGETAIRPAPSPVQVGLLGDRAADATTVSLERTEDPAVWRVVVRTRSDLLPPLAVTVDTLAGLFRDTARLRLSPACFDPVTDARAGFTRREIPLPLPTHFPDRGFPVFGAHVE